MSGEESLWVHLFKRFLYAIPTVFVVILLNFALIHASPGDPVVVLAGEQATNPEYLDMMRERYGLDRPVLEQLLVYVSKVVQGDLGYSWRYREPVLQLIMERLPATLLLTISSITFATLLGVIFGVYASRKPYSLGDNLITMSSLAGYSMPIFWLGLLAILVFSLNLNLFPIGGFRSIPPPESVISAAIDIIHHLVLPVIVLGVNSLALTARLTRGNMLEVLGMDYILTARSKGLSESAVYYKHALKNAILPIVTVIGLQARWLFAGAILTETTFSFPGMGRLMFESILFRDYPTIMGVLVITTIIVIAANFIADFLYSVLDPRVRRRIAR